MLIEFSVENYRSIYKRQTLSMVASNDKEMLDRNSFAIPNSRLRALATAAIYGPNGSGKSNLVQAMQTLKLLVAYSATRMQLGSKLPVKPFLLDAEATKKPTCFEIIFIQNQVRYEYGISLDQQRIHEEWLIAYPKGRPQNWFSRTYQPEKQETQADQGYEWDFSPALKGGKHQIKNFVRPNSLFLSHAAQNNHPQLTPIYQWVENLGVIGPDFSSFYTAARCEIESEFLKKVIEMLNQADMGISGIDFNTKSLPNDKKNILEKFNHFVKEVMMYEIELTPDSDELKITEVVTVHQMIDSEQVATWSIEEESNGTQRLFEIAGPWLEVLETGKVLIMDELDRSLHPVMSKFLVKMFQNPQLNQNGAQLIFTTHDTALLDKEIFRRDQVWFTEKDRSMTHLYSLLDFRPKPDESLQRGYLLGRYGAIPFVGGLHL
ncbi:MAG: ATP/GTP-binding protein [Oscillatoriaceae cyanobacterium]